MLHHNAMFYNTEHPILISIEILSMSENTAEGCEGSSHDSFSWGLGKEESLVAQSTRETFVDCLRTGWTSHESSLDTMLRNTLFRIENHDVMCVDWRVWTGRRENEGYAEELWIKQCGGPVWQFTRFISSFGVQLCLKLYTAVDGGWYEPIFRHGRLWPTRTSYGRGLPCKHYFPKYIRTLFRVSSTRPYNTYSAGAIIYVIQARQVPWFCTMRSKVFWW